LLRCAALKREEMKKTNGLNRFKEFIFKRGASDFCVQYAHGTQFAGVHHFFTIKQANEFIIRFLGQAQPEVWK
jgi:hypothetical protein